MPLSVDLECSIDELCAEVLRPWSALDDDDALELGSLEDAARTLAAHDGKVRALRVVDDSPEGASPEHLRALLASPALRDVEALMLPKCKLGGDGGRAIAAAALPKLRLLDVRRTAIGDVGATAIAASELCARLEHVSVAGAFLTAVGFHALLYSPLGKRSRSLHIEEEGQPESIIPTLMQGLYELGKGDASKVARAFARLLQHPALTDESRGELRYQWDLVMSH